MLAINDDPIDTVRLSLRPLHPGDGPDLWPVLSDPAIYTFIPQDVPTDPAAVAARFARVCAGPADGIDQWRNWTVWRRDTGQAIGMVECTVQPDGSVLLAYLFASAHWGHGFAREGVWAVIAKLFAAGVERFEAILDTRNAASRTLVSALGFQLTRQISAAEFFKGASSDEEVWELRRPQ